MSVSIKNDSGLNFVTHDGCAMPHGRLGFFWYIGQVNSVNGFRCLIGGFEGRKDAILNFTLDMSIYIMMHNPRAPTQRHKMSNPLMY